MTRASARTGVAGLVREYFRSHRSGTAAAAASELGKPRTAVYAAMRDLLDAGYLKKDELMIGLYHVVAAPDEPSGSADLQVKIWRAIRINRKFTNWDLALYSGATLDYVKRYISILQGAGHIVKTGRKGRRLIYQLAATAPRETPRMSKGAQRRPGGRDLGNDLLETAWEIVRALQAGDRTAAAEAHRRLGEALGREA